MQLFYLSSNQDRAKHHLHITLATFQPSMKCEITADF